MPDNLVEHYKFFQFKYFFILLSCFSATWLISNIAAVKLVVVFGITLTGGFIIFPVTSFINTIIVEIYGYKNARQAIWSGFILNLLFVFLIFIVNIIPASPDWHYETEFHHILIPSARIIMASLISYCFSDFINCYIMAKMKLNLKAIPFKRRVVFSTAVSMCVDVSLFLILAFLWTIKLNILIKLIAVAYVKKMLVQIILLPFIWYFIEKIKCSEGVEIYDVDTEFTPFSLDNVYDFHSYKKILNNEPIIHAQR